MTTADWYIWTAYELVIAAAVFAKSVFWFHYQVRDAPTALASWVSLLLLAFFAALGVTWWRATSHFVALLAFGLASAVILSAAVNAAYKGGSKTHASARNQERPKATDT